MSRINGEKARAAVEKKRRAKQREASLAAKNGPGANDPKKPGGRPMATDNLPGNEQLHVSLSWWSLSSQVRARRAWTARTHLQRQD